MKLNLTLIPAAFLAAAGALAQTPVKDAENPALTPVTRLCWAIALPNELSKTCDLYTVPPGKRLVIETVAGRCMTSAPQDGPVSYISDARLEHSIEGSAFPAMQYLAIPFTGVYGGQRRYRFTHQTRFYADPGVVRLRASRVGTGVDGGCTVTISGHLVTLP